MEVELRARDLVSIERAGTLIPGSATVKDTGSIFGEGNSMAFGQYVLLVSVAERCQSGTAIGKTDAESNKAELRRCCFLKSSSGLKELCNACKSEISKLSRNSQHFFP